MVNTTIIEQVLKLDIESNSGFKVFELGLLNIPKDDTILVKGYLMNYEGNLSLSLNGILDLKSNEESYRINMPCLISINEPCYRITMVIPGYDELLQIAGGEYNVTLIIN